MRQKDEKKRKRIFEAALQMIAEEGFSGLHMQPLAKRAEMATGTLYLYFQDKSSLLADMHGYYTEWLASHVVAAPKDNGSFEERFRKTWFNYLLFIQKYPAIIGFLEYYPSEKESATQEGNTSLPEKTLFSNLISEGQQLGVLRIGNPKVIETLILGAAHRWVVCSHNEGLPPSADYIHLAWEMTWKAIQR
ncbi:MAG: hypothetical protein C0424_02980 [Sphingobacteriaceae bacterium]|nr:hypothetical protein [Sphingobacteriaceae bacterium]